MGTLTLCAIDCINPKLAARALEISIDRCQAHSALLLSDQKLAGRFQSVAIPKITSLAQYSAFVLGELHKYVATSHVLLVQWDGYILDASAWTDEFLTYDYIGAVLPWFPEGMRVGNGGFSLRSKRLLESVASLNWRDHPDVNEDVMISAVLKPQLESQFSIRFAPESAANRFAYERSEPLDKTFGFHGLFNFWRHMSPAEVLSVVSALDDSTLVSRQYFELVGHYVRAGDLAMIRALGQVVATRHSSEGFIQFVRRWNSDEAVTEALCRIVLGLEWDAQISVEKTIIVPAVLEPKGFAALDLPAALALGEELEQFGGTQALVALYRAWLSSSNSPVRFVARFNLGRLLADMGALDEASASYEQAIAERPGFVQAMLNLGSIRERQGNIPAALALWREAIAKVSPGDTASGELLKHGLNSLGRVLEQQHSYAEAEAMLVRSLEIDPGQQDVIHHWVHLRQKQCEWPVFVSLPGLPAEKSRSATSALAMLSASNDPHEQLTIAQNFAREKINSAVQRLSPHEGYQHDRLRIGYLSSNLNWHAVTILTAEVYELHDRSKVEVYGFCWSPEDNTPMRHRVRAAMDHLVRIDQMTDEQAAHAIRAAEIDVLIDLQGLTAGSRPQILAYRPAPVQATWLGFPGSSGLPGVDYIIADQYLIPEAETPYYSEKPIYLPDCFQSNDRQRAIHPPRSRAENGLPEDGLVLCAFNHNHKFTPELFSVWMNILLAVPKSVLWLLADNPSARANLEREAIARGIDPTRLIFAPRVQPGDYLARFMVADLFLDTFPFNGGTTVSDALWAGLPVLTCSGRTFASRMAGSLLNAIGLSDMVTNSFADYEARAISLALNPDALNAIRARLAQNRETYPLFDTPRFVKAFEQALLQVVGSVSDGSLTRL